MSRLPPRRNPRRFAMGMVEILVGMAILAAGLFPVFQMMSGTRGMLAQSQEMLLLQGAAIAGLEQARSVIQAGQMQELEVGEEELFQTLWAEVLTSVRVRRSGDGELFRVVARSTLKERFFVVEGVVADPAASYTPALEVTE